MGRTIFIGTRKGGVGKTMTTASLGFGLARQGKRTLLIDADSQHSLTVSLGVAEPDKLTASLASVMTEAIGVDDFLDPTQNIRAGLYILRGLFEKYDDPAKVLMAYNLGESGAKRLWEQGVFETSYTKNILTYANK
ncbi:MAG: AAA family ATPase, partial [Tannerella sp.]|nr:AAA family ATPase [Tannerella sp.]